MRCPLPFPATLKRHSATAVVMLATTLALSSGAAFAQSSAEGSSDSEAAPAPPLWGDLVPDILVETTLLDLALWQWTALLSAVAIVAALSWLLAVLLVGFLRRVAMRAHATLVEELLGACGGPIRLGLGVVLYRSSMAPLRLPDAASDFLEVLLRALFVVAVAWSLLRVVDVVSRRVEHRLLERGQAPATGLVPPGRKAVKALVVVLSAVALFDAFGFNVAALVAGLGVGGIAVALAAQKTIENLFGGVTLYADRPVRVGDFCRFGDQIGTVEEIGVRSTRVRTLDRTVVSVPNAEFVNMKLENFAVRDRMRIATALGLRYETTPDQLRYVLVEIRRLLYAHAKVTPDPARIRFVGFGAHSLDLEIFAYVDTRDWNEFLGIREDIYLRIMDIVKASGSGFAFPSRTLYLGRDEAPLDERAREISEQVGRWREKQELFLPDFPPARIQELSGSVPYPPPGAPDPAKSEA